MRSRAWLNHCGAEDETLRVVGATDSFVYLAGSTPQLGAGDAAVVALDTASGTRQFEIPVPEMNESYHLDALNAGGPFAADDVIVLTILEGSAIFNVGYDATDGVELWRNPAAERFVAANADGVVVVAEASVFDTDVPGTHRVFAGLDRSSGEVLWELDDPDTVTISVVNGLLVLIRLDPATNLFSSNLVVDALTGARVWESDSSRGFAVRAGDALVSLDIDFTNPGETTVTGVDAATGEALWSQPASLGDGIGAPNGGAIMVPLVAGDDRVYIRQDASLVALEASTGDRLWSGGLDAAPVGGTPSSLIALTADELHLIEPADGTAKWSATLGVTSRITNIVADAATVYISWN